MERYREDYVVKNGTRKSRSVNKPPTVITGSVPRPYGADPAGQRGTRRRRQFLDGGPSLEQCPPAPDRALPAPSGYAVEGGKLVAAHHVQADIQHKVMIPIALPGDRSILVQYLGLKKYLGPKANISCDFAVFHSSYGIE